MLKEEMHPNLDCLDCQRSEDQRSRGPAGRQAQNGSHYR